MSFNPKIFLADDDPFYGLFYEQMLRSLGYTQVTVFQDGELLIHALDQHPEIVFLDYDMEPLDGIDTLRKIKKHNSNIYVVFISGHASIGVSINAMKYGGFDYIVKGEGDLEKIENVMRRIREIGIPLEERKQA